MPEERFQTVRWILDPLLVVVIALCLAWVIVVWVALMLVAVPVLIPLAYLVDFLSPGPESVEELAQ